MAELPRGLVPRLLTREQAAAYCGVQPDTFDEWRRRKIVPEPVLGTKRWDRHAIDRMLNSRSGIDDTGEDDFNARRREAKRRQQGRAQG